MDTPDVTFDTARRTHPLAALIDALLTGDIRAATHPHRTALAIEFLIQQGQIHAVTRVAPVLAEKFAGDAYFTTLTQFLRGIPDVNTPGGFVDDPRNDLQCVMHANAQATVIAFCGASHRLGMPLGLFHAWLQPLRVNVIYLRDFRQRFYLDGIASIAGGVEALCERLRALPALTAGLPLLCMGSSRGGYGAIMGAMRLRADATLCFAGPTHLGAGFLRDHNIASDYSELYAWRPDLASESCTDLRTQWLAHQRLAHAGELRIIHGKDNADDAAQAGNMARLPGVTLEALPACEQHNIALALCERGFMGAELARWLETGSYVHAARASAL